MIYGSFGNHRLLCGDARAADHYAKALEKAKAQFVFTDPPTSEQASGPSAEKVGTIVSLLRYL
jgi:hypothetical protein